MEAVHYILRVVGTQWPKSRRERHAGAGRGFKVLDWHMTGGEESILDGGKPQIAWKARSSRLSGLGYVVCTSDE